MSHEEAVAIQIKAARALVTEVDEACRKAERGSPFGSLDMVNEVRTLACAVSLLANICERLAKDGAP